MKALGICKTLKKKHKSKRKWKKRKFNKNLTKKFTTSFALDKIQLVFSEMSGNCFWNNYYSAFEWRNNYLNFWNASKEMQALPCSTRNKKLGIKDGIRKKRIEHDSCLNDVQECIRDLNCITLNSTGDSASSLSQNLGTSFEDDISENSDNFEVSEEMIQFMEINMKHRADLEAEKERLRSLRQEADEKVKVSERDGIEECKAPNEATINKCRSQQMNNLYGESAPMIHGMETAIQLTFNWNCDHHKPQYWPILPFTFKFAK